MLQGFKAIDCADIEAARRKGRVLTARALPPGWWQGRGQWTVFYRHAALQNVIVLEVHCYGDRTLVRTVEDEEPGEEGTPLPNVQVRYAATAPNSEIGHARLLCLPA
jgi:PI31 proteasome regulator N-terminal